MLKVHTIEQGKFKLDGGAMFGVVPKSMWQRLNTPDDNNMCTWSMRSLLIHDGDRVILVDTGIGSKQDAKFRSHFEPFGEDLYISDLQALGYKPEDITDVLLTHLHFDHVGGALFFDSNDKPHPTYPNATYWTNEKHFNWASNPNARERASFLKENIQPLKEQNLLKFIDVEQGIQFSDHVSLRFVYGHTEAMMLPVIQLEDGRRILYTADLIPSSGHVGLPYVMSYDVRPRDTLTEKAELFEDYKSGDILVFEHDLSVEAATLTKNDRGRMVINTKGNMSDLIR